MPPVFAPGATVPPPPPPVLAVVDVALPVLEHCWLHFHHLLHLFLEFHFHRLRQLSYHSLLNLDNNLGPICSYERTKICSRALWTTRRARVSFSPHLLHHLHHQNQRQHQHRSYLDYLVHKHLF